MKHLLLFVVSLCVLAPAGLAQAPIGEIGLYADTNRDTCCVSGTGFYSVEMYVWARPTTPNGLRAVEFAIQYPSNVAPSTITMTGNLSISLGNPQNGISICYHDCESGWNWAMHQTIYVMNQDPSWAVLTKDPATTQILACDCRMNSQVGPLQKLTNLCFNFCTSNFDTPFIMNVVKIDAQNLNVVFSEKVTPESAGNIANFALYDKSTESTTVPILSAAYQSDSASVNLALGGPILAGRPYLLDARNIVDMHGSACNSKKGFGDLPNLAFASKIYSTSVKVPCGNLLDVTFQIKNDGVGPAGPFDLDVDWTADVWGLTRDASLGHHHFDGLAPGATLSLHYTYAWPDTSRIVNFVLVTLDPLNLMPESTETDNTDQSANWTESYSANHLKVTDVPGDQGKLVRFEFQTLAFSLVDVGYDPFIQYDIYRRDPSGWTLLTTIPEDGNRKYSVELATLADSTEDQGMRWSVFKVSTKAKRIMKDVPLQYFDSCPDSGYSVDNLAPRAPQGLSASMLESGITLRWTANPETDVAKYVLYRDIDPNFTPAPGNRIATIVGALEYFDGDWHPGSSYCYKLRAKDCAGNEGPCACTLPDQYVATLLKSYAATPKEAAIELTWTLSILDEGIRFAVYRAAGEGADFVEISAADVSRTGLAFTFVDGSVAGGESYRYRVAYVAGGTTHVLFETETIRTPELPLTLYQNFPNPFNPATTIRYYLPGADRVRLQVFDASGKLVATLVDAQQQKGSHTAEWKGANASGAQVRSGVYFCRLATRAQTLTHKMVLLR